jgi:hypothetical protein
MKVHLRPSRIDGMIILKCESFTLDGLLINNLYCYSRKPEKVDFFLLGKLLSSSTDRVLSFYCRRRSSCEVLGNHS